MENPTIMANYIFKLYNEKECLKLINKYDKKGIVLKAYNKISSDYLQAKSDLLRYFILFHEGGIYFDVKAKLNKNLDTALQRKELIIFNENPDKAFSQWFLAYPKNHPFMKYTLDKVVDNILGNKFKNKGGKKNVLKMSGPYAYYNSIKNNITGTPHIIINKERVWGILHGKKKILLYMMEQ